MKNKSMLTPLVFILGTASDVAMENFKELQHQISQPQIKSRVGFLRRLFLVALNSLLCVTLMACATEQNAYKLEHGFDIENAGKTQIFNVAINYGQVTREFCIRGCASGASSFYGVYMPIPDEMQVSWKTVDGVQHYERVQIKSRINDLPRFRRLFIQINGSDLVVRQGAHFKNSGLVGWEESPLYP